MKFIIVLGAFVVLLLSANSNLQKQDETKKKIEICNELKVTSPQSSRYEALKDSLIKFSFIPDSLKQRKSLLEKCPNLHKPRVVSGT